MATTAGIEPALNPIKILRHIVQGITAFVVGSPAALTRGWVRNNSKTVNHEKQDALTGMKRSYTPLRDYHINIVNLIDYWKCKQRYIQKRWTHRRNRTATSD